jgi:hypothetical protein
MAVKKRKRVGQEVKTAIQKKTDTIKKASGAAFSAAERARIAGSKPLPPRAKGSERSFAFTSTDKKGRKTTRFSDKPTPRKGEKRKRFR